MNLTEEISGKNAFSSANYETKPTSERSVKSSVNGSESQLNRQLQEIYQSSTELNETPQNTVLNELKQEIIKGLQLLANPNSSLEGAGL